jgi:hypothetical protein
MIVERILNPTFQGQHVSHRPDVQYARFLLTLRLSEANFDYLFSQSVNWQVWYYLIGCRAPVTDQLFALQPSTRFMCHPAHPDLVFFRGTGGDGRPLRA